MTKLIRTEMDALDVGLGAEHISDRERSYDRAQPHTFIGQRGAYQLGDDSNITIRDIADCVAKAWLESTGHHGKPDPTYADLYLPPKCRPDPMAIVQNACIELEKRIGIFPNVPHLKEPK